MKSHAGLLILAAVAVLGAVGCSGAPDSGEPGSVAAGEAIRPQGGTPVSGGGTGSGGNTCNASVTAVTSTVPGDTCQSDFASAVAACEAGTPTYIVRDSAGNCAYQFTFSGVQLQNSTWYWACSELPAGALEASPYSCTTANPDSLDSNTCAPTQPSQFPSRGGSCPAGSTPTTWDPGGGTKV